MQLEFVKICSGSRCTLHAFRSRRGGPSGAPPRHRGPREPVVSGGHGRRSSWPGRPRRSTFRSSSTAWRRTRSGTASLRVWSGEALAVSVVAQLHRLIAADDVASGRSRHGGSSCCLTPLQIMAATTPAARASSSAGTASRSTYSARHLSLEARCAQDQLLIPESCVS
ncbi:hypothetical protein EJB05_55016, partial [Eragrostis curvula]